MALVVKGRIVPLAADDPGAVFRGTVLVDDAGFVEEVLPARRKVPTGYEHAPVVDTGDALVFPGLIDLHNHLAYNTLPLWADATRTDPYLDHNTWPRRKTYAPDVTWPAYAFITASPEELLAYVEVKAIVGGTTSIQGSPPKNRPRDGWLVRNIEDETWGETGGANFVYASTLTEKPAGLKNRAQKMHDGALFIYHCAEGLPGSKAAVEYDACAHAGCLQPRFVGVHCSSVAPDAFAEWADAGAVAWSPFSNLWLYGKTTAVEAVAHDGLTICLGSDWAPSGTKHVLGELKVARIVSQHLGFDFTDEQLVAMVTSNPGDVLARAWPRRIGRLEAGSVADLVVIDASPRAVPWHALVHAVEHDVQLVVIDGEARYGTAQFMNAAGAPVTTPLQVNGESRLVALTRPDAPDKPWPWKDVIARLEQVRADPKAAIEAAETRRTTFAGPLDARNAPLRLELDMPTGLGPYGGLPGNLDDIVIPPLQSITHDAEWFASINGRGFHGGLLDELQKFYA
jgi:cytosine/adenosine deaminase-related metal-dependent hydrolase